MLESKFVSAVLAVLGSIGIVTFVLGVASAILHRTGKYDKYNFDASALAYWSVSIYATIAALLVLLGYALYYVIASSP